MAKSVRWINVIFMFLGYFAGLFFGSFLLKNFLLNANSLVKVSVTLGLGFLFGYLALRISEGLR